MTIRVLADEIQPGDVVRRHRRSQLITDVYRGAVWCALGRTTEPWAAARLQPRGRMVGACPSRTTHRTDAKGSPLVPEPLRANGSPSLVRHAPLPRRRRRLSETAAMSDSSLTIPSSPPDAGTVRGNQVIQ